MVEEVCKVGKNGGGGAYIDTMLYRLADGLLLLKCYDNKKVKLPGCSFIGASTCS